jgi:hypothetical protein
VFDRAKTVHALSQRGHCDRLSHSLLGNKIRGTCGILGKIQSIIVSEQKTAKKEAMAPAGGQISPHPRVKKFETEEKNERSTVFQL